MNIKTLDREVLKNLSLWLGVTEDKLMQLDGVLFDKDNSFFENVLDFNTIGPFEAFVRRLTHKLLKYFKESDRYNILDSIKRLRQLYRKDLVEITHCRFVELDKILREKLSISPIDWGGKRGVICLSHDIDNQKDYKYIKETYQLNKKYGVVSSFNFLTDWGYEIEKKLLEEFSDNGFEIGLHGYTHDIAIGIRSEDRLRRELSMALKKLDFPVKGYRAPAFAISRRLLKILKEFGIKYDSSMKTISCYSSQSAEVFYPYRYPGVDIWEVPLTIQDDRVFRDLHLSNEEAVGVIKELASRIVRIGGVCVINNHPGLIQKKIHYYQELLEWISSLKDVWVVTMGKLVEFMEGRERAIGNNDKGR